MFKFQIYLALFFESIAVFMCVFFFIQYSIIKRKEHLFYACYLLAVSIYYVLAIPELFLPIEPGELDFKNNLDMFKRPLQFLSSICYTYFVIYYLGLKKTAVPLYKFFIVLNSSYLLLSVVCLMLNYFKIPYNNIYYLISLLMLPLQFYIVMALMKNKVPYAHYIIWGTIVILAGSAFTLLISIYGSRQPAPDLVHHVNVFIPVQISIMIDMMLFTVALQKKIADNEKSLINAAFQRQRAVLLERERIIADLHDDVGGGLSSIRMMSDLMAQPNATADKTVSFAHKISAAAREIAQRMHTIIWSLNAENDTLANFVEYVRQYGITFFEDSPVSFTSTVDTNMPVNLQLNGVHRKNLFLIIKEAFHNILKHANASATSVHIFISGNILHIKISDNGTGISNPNQFGNGLKNMKKRMDEIGGKFLVTSNGGTTLLIEIAVNHPQSPVADIMD